jgi:hypothetical protein
MSMMLLLKLTLAPVLVVAATLVTQKWGPRIGGLLMGLPLTTGPIFLFLAIEQGPHFAAGTAVGILFGVAGLAAFAMVYTVSSRMTGWVACLASATAAFLIVSLGARRLGSDVTTAAVTAWLALGLAGSLMRRPELQSTRVSPPRWDLWLRILAVAVLTLATTTAAARLGPMLSGIVGTYPVAITVVVAFTHVRFGRDAALVMLRGSVLSWFSFVSCFLTIGLWIEAVGTASAMALGVLVAIATSVLVLRADRVIAQRGMSIRHTPAGRICPSGGRSRSRGSRSAPPWCRRPNG